MYFGKRYQVVEAEHDRSVSKALDLDADFGERGYQFLEM